MNRFGLLLGCVCALVAASAETIRLEPPGPGARRTVSVDPKGAASVVVCTEVPISGIQEMWTPDLSGPHQQRKWWIKNLSGPQKDFPYVAFFDVAGRNAFSFGSGSLEWDNQVSSKINQEKGVFELTLTVAAGKGRALGPFAVTLDRRALDWTNVLRAWRETLPYPKGTYPDGAWKPVFCSWYAVHAAVTQDWTERTAAIAADLGFKTFILDDGWSYDEAKRVNPKTIVTWYRDTGRWDRFSTAKFPDFKAHRERMRALGLKYLVWTAPYFVGTRSEAFKRLGFDRRADKVPFEGNVLTDVDDAAQMKSVTEQFVRLIRETDLDGLKIDFIDYIAPSVEKPLGAATLAYVEELVAAIRAVKPEALIEFRQSYATPVMAHLATQFRAGDVPFEWLDNLRRIAQIRLAMGDGVPVHADPIYWAETETSDNVDRHFLAAMAGVPMVSMDLEKLPEADRARIRRWLDFYRTRVERFQKAGRWDVRYKNGGVASLVSRLPGATLVLVNDPDVLPRLSEELRTDDLVVLNLTYEALRLPNGKSVPPASAFPAD